MKIVYLSVFDSLSEKRISEQGRSKSNFISPIESSFCMVNTVISAVGFKYFLFSILYVFLKSAVVWLSAVFGRKSLKMHVLKSRSSFTSHIKLSS